MNNSGNVGSFPTNMIQLIKNILSMFPSMYFIDYYKMCGSGTGVGILIVRNVFGSLESPFDKKCGHIISVP